VARTTIIAVVALVLAGSCTSESAGPGRGSGVDALVPPAPRPMSARQAKRVLDREGIADQEPALHVGAPAPALSVKTWLLGAPVSMKRGQVYAVENWATWCKPCIDSIPSLSALADAHRRDGLTVVAVNIEQDNDAAVRAFVDQNRAAMRYRVGLDGSGASKRDWVDAAGFPGLPASFVVDRDGSIAWVGRPSRLENVAAAVLRGDWNAAAERTRARRERLAARYSRRSVDLLSSNPARAYDLIDALLADLLRDQPDYLAGLAYHIFAAPGVPRRDLDVAYYAGALACSGRDWSEPQPIEVLSKIREEQGNMAEAIGLQRRAVAAAAENSSRYRARLSHLLRAQGRPAPAAN